MSDFELQRHPVSPGLDRRDAQVHGGPLDGTWLVFHEGFNPAGIMQVDLPVHDGALLTEPYMLVPLTDEDGEVVQWDAIWLSWYRPGIRIDRDPEVGLLRQTHAMIGSELLTEPCEPGTHEWTPWVATPRGNRTRHCDKCQVSQGSVL